MQYSRKEKGQMYHFMEQKLKDMKAQLMCLLKGSPEVLD